MMKTKLMFGLAATLTAGCAVLLAAGPATAREVTVIASFENDVPVARISYADLTLAHQPGQTTLRHRVAGAIRTVCEPVFDRSQPDGYQLCHNAAWSQARPQMAAAMARATRLASGTASASDRLALNAFTIGIGSSH